MKRRKRSTATWAAVLSAVLSAVLLVTLLPFDARAAGSSGSRAGADRDPVIIVPGIMGSELYTTADPAAQTAATRIWDPYIGTDPETLREELKALGLTGADLSDPAVLSQYGSILLSLDPASAAAIVQSVVNIAELPGKLADDTLYVRPAEEQHGAREREYGTEDAYKNLVDSLCAAYPDREIYFFSYDWRQSNAESAKKLDAFIRTLSAPKVDLVCHSMGGLVAASCYQESSSRDRIDRIIVCGTPFEGAPVMLDELGSWNALGSGAGIAAALSGVSGSGANTGTGDLPGILELAPTQKYVSVIPACESAAGSSAQQQLTYDRYRQLLDGMFTARAGSAAKAFQDSVLDADGWDVLADCDRAYFIVGTGQKTVCSVTITDPGTGTAAAGSRRGRSKSRTAETAVPYVSDLAYGTTGDGTVPLESATMLYRVLALDPSRWQLIRTNHIGTADSDEAVRSIRSVLDTGTLRESTGAAPGAYVVVKVTGPAAVTVTRGGETLSSELLDFENAAAFGRMDIAGSDGEIKLFCLDPGDSAVTIRGTGSGTAQCEIRYYDAANTLTGVHSYSGIPLTKGAVLRTGTGAAQAASLEIDTDGDGTADRRVSG